MITYSDDPRMVDAEESVRKQQRNKPARRTQLKQQTYSLFQSIRSFLYSEVSSSWDCSKCFTLHPLADLFIPMPPRLPWEAFSHTAITAQIYLFTYPPRSIARHSFIQLSELRQRGVNEIVQALIQQQEDSNPGPLD